MERIRVTWATRVLALVAGGLCAGIAGSTPLMLAQGPDALVMVANKSNPAAASMTKGDAKKLLLGQMSSGPAGSPSSSCSPRPAARSVPRYSARSVA